jgi:hypothetical protein
MTAARARAQALKSGSTDSATLNTPRSFAPPRPGHRDAVGLMVDLGFPLDARAAGVGMALRAAAYSGSAPVVRPLLKRGAAIEARDTIWDSSPLGWAAVGSGYQPDDDPAADWIETVTTLLEFGVSTDEITFSPDDPKPPSPEIAALLREHGNGRPQ